MRSKSRHPRPGFTLVEMLVTTMVMLIMVLAMSQMFALIGRHVTDGRALIEMQGQVRASAFRIQEDLDGLTILARTSPHQDWEVGYLEYIEGIDFDASDNNASPPKYTVGSDLNPWFVNDTRVDDTVTPPIPVIEVQPIPVPDPTEPLLPKPNEPLNAVRTVFGDIDDVLMFTARSTVRPFVGRIQGSLTGGGGSVIQSHDAEIIYWTQWNDTDEDGTVGLGEITLHRRVLLIRPDLVRFDNPNNSEFPDNMPGYEPQMTSAQLQTFYNNNDLSVRPIPATVNGNAGIRLMPNSLADLAVRANRVAHLPNQPLNNQVKSITQSDFPLSEHHFPNRFTRAWLPQHFGTRAGEDIVQSDVLAFDVRAYDPTAPIRQGGAAGTPVGDVLMPGDWGWASANNTLGRGAYVDLNYAEGTASPNISVFSGRPTHKSGLNAFANINTNRPLAPTYDTWTWRYERDGINQELAAPAGTYSVTGVTDEGTNGIDDDNQFGVDDAGERETSPPYPVPLRGLQVTLRVIELDTRQVRQTSVSANFTPE